MHLPYLQYLNLQNNYLKKFPNLDSMRKLTVLNLNSNQIVDFKDFEPENTPNLKTLEVEDNQIVFQSGYDMGPREGIDVYQVRQDDFGDFIKKMNALEKLKSLNIAENPLFSLGTSDMLRLEPNHRASLQAGRRLIMDRLNVCSNTP